MTQIVAIHSFRGGTGKSNISANLAVALGLQGLRVAVVDTDLASPGIHVLFGFSGAGRFTLNDHLQDEVAITDCCHDVTPAEVKRAGGHVFLVPASMERDRIARLLREGYKVEVLNDALFSLGHDRKLDVILIDTHPGINEETLLSAAISDCLVMVMRPDSQDYLGTAVAIQVAQQLDVPRTLIAVNKLPQGLDPDRVRQRVIDSYAVPVGALLPLSDDLLAIASGGLAILQYPEHAWSLGLQHLATQLLNAQ
jgi:MinD-like ATPase involved in chromosome partitioning or flagellar assembly